MDYERLSKGVQSTPIELRIKSLKGRIQAEIAYIEKKLRSLKTSTDYDKEEQQFILTEQLSYCKEVSVIPITDERDYNFVKWLFNNGNFREQEEIERKAEQLKREAEEERIKQVRSSPEYNKGYHPFLVYLGTFFGAPCLISMIFLGAQHLPDRPEMFFTETLGGMILAFAYGFIPMLIISAIVTLIYCKIHDSDFDVPLNEEVLGAVAGATITGCATYYFKTKSNEQKAVSNTV